MVLHFLLRYADSYCPYGIFKLFSGQVFQHGNPRCYVARVCQYFLNQNHTRFLPCSAISPNQSTIAHVYDELSRRVHHPQNIRETLQALRDAVYEWNNITKVCIQWLFGCMRRRCEAVVAARGVHTRYWTPQTHILHDNVSLSMICSDNDVETCCWYCLICYAHMNLKYTMFANFASLYKK